MLLHSVLLYSRVHCVCFNTDRTPSVDVHLDLHGTMLCQLDVAFASWPQNPLCVLIDDISSNFCIIIYCTGGWDAWLAVLWLRKMFAASQWRYCVITGTGITSPSFMQAINTPKI